MNERVFHGRIGTCGAAGALSDFSRRADGKDLTAALVGDGLGWARGIYRRSPDGASRDVYEARIKGLEQAAALKHLLGESIPSTWKITNGLLKR